MAQTVQILRTTTNNPPPTLLPGALSVELGTQTKLWVGSAGGNRLLMSSDPSDIALSSSCVVAATPPANPIPGLLWWDSTGGQLYVRYQDANSTAWIAAASATGSFLPISGGTLTGPLILAADPAVPLGAATKAYVDGFLPLSGGTLTGWLTVAGGLTVANPTAADAFIDMRKGATGNFANVISARRGANMRWQMMLGDTSAESGSNAGSNFLIKRWNDAGVEIDTPLSINRATGAAQHVSTALPTLETRGVAGNPPTTGTARTGLLYLSQSTDTSAASIGIRSGGAGLWLQSHDAADQATKYPLLLNPSGGNVGIRTGTNAPSGALTVAGQAAAGGVVSQIWSGPAGSDTSTWMMAFYAFDGSTVVGGIPRNGSNTVAYNTSSDARLKENITDTNIGLAELLQLKVRDYNFKGDERQEHGLIAQEVVDIYPLAVRVGGDDPRTEPWMIEYGRLVPLLIKAAQELAARVQTLEGAP